MVHFKETQTKVVSPLFSARTFWHFGWEHSRFLQVDMTEFPCISPVRVLHLVTQSVSYDCGSTFPFSKERKYRFPSAVDTLHPVISA